jgi:cysteine desulfurase
MNVAIYLDHAATSPMTPAVIAAYVSALSIVGNPASIHSQGQAAKRILEEAREAVAASVGADSVEVTFTSGGTEAVNLGVHGLYLSRTQRGAGAQTIASQSRDASPDESAIRRLPVSNRILATHAEHHATIDTLAWLEQHEGAVIEWIAVDATGRIDLEELSRALDDNDDVALVTTLWANNEVGTIQPVADIVALAAARGVPVHCDAVAAYGYVPIDFHDSGLAALSISAHKIGGPVGIGALVVARRETVTPLIHGGSQQRFRSGTQDAASAAAFGVAATRAVAAMATTAPRLAQLRDRLVSGIRSAEPTAIYRGDLITRLPGNAHFTFAGCEGDSLLFLLDAAGFSVSTGSACQAGVPEASHVLLAMGLSESDARGALRITLGPESTSADVDAFVEALPLAVARARGAGLAGAG